MNQWFGIESWEHLHKSGAHLCKSGVHLLYKSRSHQNMSPSGSQVVTAQYSVSFENVSTIF